MHITALSQEQRSRRLPLSTKLHQVLLKLTLPHVLLAMTAVAVMGMAERGHLQPILRL